MIHVDADELFTFVCWGQVRQPQLRNSVGTWVRFASTLIKGLVLCREFGECNHDNCTRLRAEVSLQQAYTIFHFNYKTCKLSSARNPGANGERDEKMPRSVMMCSMLPFTRHFFFSFLRFSEEKKCGFPISEILL